MSHELESKDAAEFYRNRAETYHDATDKVQLELTIAASSLLKTPPRLLLDLGCGSGLSTSILARQWNRAFIIAADISTDMLCVGKNSGCLSKPHIDAVKLDFSRPLPFRTTILDTAVSISAIQWLFVRNTDDTTKTCSVKSEERSASEAPVDDCNEDAVAASRNTEQEREHVQSKQLEPDSSAEQYESDLDTLLHELRRILTPSGEMSLQFYPLKGDPKSVEYLRNRAEAIFGKFPQTAVVLDYPHGNAHRKYFLRMVPTDEVRSRPWCALCWPICDAVCRYQMMHSGLEKAHEEMAVRFFRNLRFLQSKPSEDGGRDRRPKKKRKCVDDILDVQWKVDCAQEIMDEFSKHESDQSASIRDQLVSALGSEGLISALHKCKDEWLFAPEKVAFARIP